MSGELTNFIIEGVYKWLEDHSEIGQFVLGTVIAAVGARMMYDSIRDDNDMRSQIHMEGGEKHGND